MQDWCTTISTTGPIYAKSSDFYTKLNVIKFECNKFVLVLAQVELIRTISRYNQKTDTTAQLYIVH